MVAKQTGRRLGRPPASSSVETRQRILDVARQSFAELGYGVTTNNHIATKAGITTGALYHYFDSKLAIYLAVHDEVEALVRTHYEQALAAHDTFVDRLFAILEVSWRLNAHDPSIARFLGSARVDVVRHDELREHLSARPAPIRDLLRSLVDHGVSTGEIPPGREAQVFVLLRVLLVGLAGATSGDLAEQRAAIEAIGALVHGRLLAPPAG
jgi:TetR/AcrR family transcriptional repressor of uid operon